MLRACHGFSCIVLVARVGPVPRVTDALIVACFSAHFRLNYNQFIDSFWVFAVWQILLG